MSPDPDTNNWLEYRREILYRLDELAKGQRATDGRIETLQTSVTEIQTQRGIAGWTVSLALTALVSALVSWATGRAV